MNIRIRVQWGARLPLYVVPGHLVAQSTEHWNGPTITVGGKTTWDHSKCDVLVRGIQNYHMDIKGWSDIAYNFVICPHGIIYEGRGLNVVNGANGTNSGNRSSHAIMSLAGELNAFSEAERAAIRDCAMYIANRVGAVEGCMGHRDHKQTKCPGDARYKWVHKGMPLETPVAEPQIVDEEDAMNEPLEIVRGNALAWYVTDGITKQWIQNREHAAILCINRGAKAQVKPANMSADELQKMAPFEWPQAAIDSLRLVGPKPPM